MRVRTGFGFDVHPLVKGFPLILGGVTVPHEKGLQGYSDADVLIHAICDALLGAIAQGDIGSHFPDFAEEYRNISSTVILEKTMDLIKKEAYTVSNIDSTICLEKPKIASYIQDMRKKLSTIIKVAQDQINIKATTTEKLGFIGAEQGIAAYAVACLYKIP